MKEEEVRKYKRGKQKGMRRREGKEREENAEARMGWEGGSEARGKDDLI